jgi:hypothetical protein
LHPFPNIERVCRVLPPRCLEGDLGHFVLCLPHNLGALSEKMTAADTVELKPQLVAVAFDLAPYFAIGIPDQFR